MSLNNNLSRFLADAGHRDEALAAIEEAVEILAWPGGGQPCRLLARPRDHCTT
jgi:hypothetical protein